MSSRSRADAERHVGLRVFIDYELAGRLKPGDLRSRFPFIPRILPETKGSILKQIEGDQSV